MFPSKQVCGNILKQYEFFETIFISTHGTSQRGPYSRVRDLLATFTLNFSFYCVITYLSGHLFDKMFVRMLTVHCDQNNSYEITINGFPV